MGLLGPMGPAGFRRRGRRRGLIVGAAVGAGVARSRNKNTDNQAEEAPTNDADVGSQLDELEKLGDLKSKGLLTDEEFAAKKKEILGT